MTNYTRRFPRDPYEGLLVRCLVACGYQVNLSSGLEDEIFGEDARDTEHDVPWDFYIGNGNNGRYAEKLAKAEANRVAVLRVPATLVANGGGLGMSWRLRKSVGLITNCSLAVFFNPPKNQIPARGSTDLAKAISLVTNNLPSVCRPRTCSGK